jgi:serine/threonine-protein kinase
VSVEALGASLSDRYRIERELGTGGMATVYLAADLKHDRQVAIKVLKPELAAVLGADRFVQEIKTTAALSHPHILPLFDSGSVGQGGSGSEFLYYVMPFIEGETIRERLNRETQLGIDDAVRITREVADALDYAHRHGVIHRDIKPENILLHDGRAMVMDFGIALAVSAAAGGRMTETGLSLGTPHYMSPEQATADKSITGRSDIYSLASVLYEMLAGEPPHLGGSAQQIIMKIVTDLPRPVTELRKSVPTNVAAALMKALEKLPADRFDSAKAFSEALGNPNFTTETSRDGGAGSVVPGQWMRSRYSQLAIAVSVALGAAVAWLSTRGQPDADVPEAVIAFTLMDSVGGSFPFDVADDGTIAYTRGDTLYVQRPGDRVGSEVRRNDVSWGSSVFFSPDGTQLVVTLRSGTASEGISTIARLPVDGGIATPLATSPFGLTAPLAWSEEGWIYAVVMQAVHPDSIAAVRFRDTGGEPELVARGFIVGIAPLPGGRAVAVCEMEIASASQRGNVYVLDIASGDTTQVAFDACSPRWSPTGHLLVTRRDGTLAAIPFDPVRRRATGEPIALISDLAVNTTAAAEYRLTRDGTLLYLRGEPSPSIESEYLLVGLDGTHTVLPIARGALGSAAFAPDRRTIAYTRDGRLFTYDLNLGTNRAIGGTTLLDGIVWSPDGRQLAIFGANFALTVRSLNDTTGRQVGAAGPDGVAEPTQWLPEGTILVQTYGGTNHDIATVHVDSSGEQRTVLGADWEETNARVSHDGRWIAYASNEPGHWQLTVRTWPALENKAVVADSIMMDPLRWAPDDRTLYYRKDQRVMAVSLAGGDSLRATTHRVVTDSGYGLVDLHPDGQQLLVRRRLSAPPAAQRSLVGITGWLSELKRKAAAAGRR